MTVEDQNERCRMTEQAEGKFCGTSRSSLDSQDTGATVDTSSRRTSTRVRTVRQPYEPDDFLEPQSEAPRSRSTSPSKRRTGPYGNRATGAIPRGGLKSGIDGLALLLMACEILDRDHEPGTNGPSDRAGVSTMLDGFSQCVSAPINAVAIAQHVSPFSDQYTGMRVPSASAASRAPRKKVTSPRKSGGVSPRKRGEKPVGPCMNPHCMNPNESPQWRRGPPEAAVLCNACGTRWIRNKSLVPIVPQRGIRYGKDGNPNRSPSRSPTRSPSRSASPRKVRSNFQTTNVDQGEVLGAEPSISTERLSLASDKSSMSVTGARVINLVADISGMLTTH